MMGVAHELLTRIGAGVERVRELTMWQLDRPRTVLVTGGAGFVGGHLVSQLLSATDWRVVIMDRQSEGRRQRHWGSWLSGMEGTDRLRVYVGDVANRPWVTGVLRECDCDGVVHLAAHAHVDDSICDPGRAMRNNVLGTFELLEASRGYWAGLAPERREAFCFLHVSTAEVYGSSLDHQGFAEEAPYRPSSPYAASKAAADQFVHAFGVTYGLPVIVTHCCNNFGPRQLANKLVPLTIGRALRREPIHVYGRGENLRDWIHVQDHCEALVTLLSRGVRGQVYHIAGGNLLTNLSMVTTLCNTTDHLLSRQHERPSTDLIEFVADRPGHDQCCILDGAKLIDELDWLPRTEFSTGIVETVGWYVENSHWFDWSR